MPWNRRHKASTTLSPRTPTLAGRGCPLLSLLSAWSLSSPGQFRSRFFLASHASPFRIGEGSCDPSRPCASSPHEESRCPVAALGGSLMKSRSKTRECLTRGRDGLACGLPKQYHRVSAPGAPRLGLAIEFARRAIAQYAPQDRIAGRKRVVGAHDHVFCRPLADAGNFTEPRPKVVVVHSPLKADSLIANRAGECANGFCPRACQPNAIQICLSKDLGIGKQT